MPAGVQHPYRGLWAAVATMHGKERAIAPPLCQWFDMTISTAPGIDTDALGTFTGEIARKGTMRDSFLADVRNTDRLVTAGRMLIAWRRPSHAGLL